MPRHCQISGKKVTTGNNVSHSHTKTKRTFEANLQRVSLFSEALKRPIRLRVSTRALRSVTKAGGLDAYLRKTADAKLAPEAVDLKKKIRRA